MQNVSQQQPCVGLLTSYGQRNDPDCWECLNGNHKELFNRHSIIPCLLQQQENRPDFRSLLLVLPKVMLLSVEVFVNWAVLRSPKMFNFHSSLNTQKAKKPDGWDPPSLHMSFICFSQVQLAVGQKNGAQNGNALVHGNVD